MTTKKRIFYPRERKLFHEILKKYTAVVESRETDSASLKVKNEVWDAITREFNAQADNPGSTHKQLRRLWMNMKQRQKDVLKNLRQNRVATGDGPPTMRVATGDRPPTMRVATGDRPTTMFNTTTSTTSTCDSNTNAEVPEAAPTLIVKVEGSGSGSDAVSEKESSDRNWRCQELHNLQLELLQHKIREAKAKADLAEYILHKQKGSAMRDECERSYDPQDPLTYFVAGSTVQAEQHYSNEEDMDSD